MICLYLSAKRVEAFFMSKKKAVFQFLFEPARKPLRPIWGASSRIFKNHGWITDFVLPFSYPPMTVTKRKKPTYLTSQNNLLTDKNHLILNFGRSGINKL
jgi:hypothetical protein